MILVTGGTGMAGGFIVRELQSRGHAVRVLARRELEQVARDLGVDLALGDLADVNSVRRAVQGVSGIIHVACTFTQPEVDIAAMQALVEQWGTGAFVFISSVDVYGYPRVIPATEEHPLDPHYSFYGGGKVRCEALLCAQAEARGRHDISILRPPHIWGPHPKCRERLVNARMLAGQPVVLPGNTPEEWTQFGDDWVDTREPAWAGAECLDRPLNGAANAITGHFLWHEVYAELIRLTGSSSVIEHKALDAITEEELPNKGFYAQLWRSSGEHLQQHLGFQPTHRWQDTIAEIV